MVFAWLCNTLLYRPIYLAFHNKCMQLTVGFVSALSIRLYGGLLTPWWTTMVFAWWCNTLVYT